MKLALTILLAYAVTGIFFVFRDLTERNTQKITGFALNYRTGGGWLNLLVAWVSWLPATFISAYWKPNLAEMRREGMTIVFFVCAAIFIWLILN